MNGIQIVTCVESIVCAKTNTNMIKITICGRTIDSLIPSVFVFEGVVFQLAQVEQVLPRVAHHPLAAVFDQVVEQDERLKNDMFKTFLT